MITQLIEFDVNKNSHVKITAKEGDINSRNLEFRLLDNSLPFSLAGRTVRCYMVKPDKRIVFSELQIIDAEDGRCVLTLSLQSLIVSGMAKLELIIYEAGKKLSIIPIKMNIIKSLNSDKLLESTNEFGALNDALWKIDTFKASIDSKASKEDLKKLSSQLDTKANVEYVDNKISKVASGSPKGIYPTLNDLNIAKPTGDNGIYITTDNGCWNYWNGNAWVSGGIYQGVKIDYNSISQKHLTFPAIQGKERINLYDKESAVKGSYVDRETGNIFANASYSYCDYIEILPSMNYMCNATDNGEQLAFYDSNKTYISGLLLKDNNKFVTPSNAEYVRITVKITNIAQFMFVMGTELPSEYKPFVKPTSLYFEDSLNELEQAIFKSGLSENLRREKINYFNKAKAIQGYYIERTDGSAKANENYYCSEYIEVQSDFLFATNMSDNGEQVAFYDSAKNYISGLLTPTTFTTPINAKYLRVGIHKNNLERFMLTPNSLPLTYKPYYSLVLENVIVNEVAREKSLIVVSKKGDGDYMGIQEAINNAQDSSANPVVILIYPGIYEERPYITPDRYISLIGLDKTTTIILDKSGNHATGGVRFEGTGYMKNITCIQTCEEAEDLNKAQAYALHIDNVDGLGGNSTFEDCVFKSRGSAGVGIGLQQDQTIRFKNCEFYSTAPKSSGASSCGSFIIHSSNRRADVTGQKLIMENCYGHSLYTSALEILDLGTGNHQMDVTFINNNFWCEETETKVSLTEKTTGNLSGVINLTKRSYGNNIPILNS